MKKFRLLAALMLIAAFFVACGSKSTVVESGTYQGTVEKVNAPESEIYVKTPDGKTLELYFTPATNLTQGDSAVEFTALQTGQSVTVKVEKKGKKLDPLAVEIH